MVIIMKLLFLQLGERLPVVVRVVIVIHLVVFFLSVCLSVFLSFLAGSIVPGSLSPGVGVVGTR